MSESENPNLPENCPEPANEPVKKRGGHKKGEGLTGKTIERRKWIDNCKLADHMRFKIIDWLQTERPSYKEVAERCSVDLGMPYNKGAVEEANEYYKLWTPRTAASANNEVSAVDVPWKNEIEKTLAQALEDQKTCKRYAQAAVDLSHTTARQTATQVNEITKLHDLAMQLAQASNVQLAFIQDLYQALKVTPPVTGWPAPIVVRTPEPSPPIALPSSVPPAA
jgi:hypothetical protein